MTEASSEASDVDADSAVLHFRCKRATVNEARGEADEWFSGCSGGRGDLKVLSALGGVQFLFGESEEGLMRKFGLF